MIHGMLNLSRAGKVIDGFQEVDLEELIAIIKTDLGELIRSRRAEVRVAAPLPLTSFADDVAALDRTLERVTGPVVLVGHAYAGAVIAATRDEKVKALVYVAALAPMRAKASPTCSTVQTRTRRPRSFPLTTTA